MTQNSPTGTQYPLATIGSLTERIEYADGSRAQIIAGVGIPDMSHFKPVAVAGSMLDNGAMITDSPHRKAHATSFVPTHAGTTTH